ncbi:MAG: glutamine--fructose-6-phosphate transaminase (isomerizing) [Gammaproteobacteria bacterium]|nr:glutamine--fructose-6-phosphate transaminase (isomerizing) [Gammaproteobacteria bacterium]
MCGIIGGVAERNLTPILLEGLKRLEYRGYDSAGLAVVGEEGVIKRIRTPGKVSQLEKLLGIHVLTGQTGIAHTRWATHGEPTENNAHPHMTKQSIAVVHNGIIENYESLRRAQKRVGYGFSSETDTEVIVHAIHHNLKGGCDLLQAVQKTVRTLEGAFAIAVIAREEPNRLVAVRKGSPLVVGLGIGEHYVASDHLALAPVTNRFIVLEEGDVADMTQNSLAIYNEKGERQERPIQILDIKSDVAEKGTFRHFMLKEIFYQPQAIQATLDASFKNGVLVDTAFGMHFSKISEHVQAVHFVACGTSFHAAKIAAYWFEAELNLPCWVEVASEYRYRKAVIPEGCLFVTLSQSGETADTLAALRCAKRKKYLATLAICNVANSSLVRESDLVYLTHAGIEIGVASTKAFTAQLVALLSLMVGLGQGRKGVHPKRIKECVKALTQTLVSVVQKVLALSSCIKEMAQKIEASTSILFLGRGPLYPVAMEGALKLKEISYIHAEAYPAGELKHGPLALVDKTVPVIALAEGNSVHLEKLKSNLEEVRARGGHVILFAEDTVPLNSAAYWEVLKVPSCHPLLSPLIHVIPLQLLAYHVAVMKGTDVDQPRNLAKSVTVE